MAIMWSAVDRKQSLEKQLAWEQTAYCFLISGRHQCNKFMTAPPLLPSSAWKFFVGHYSVLLDRVFMLGAHKHFQEMLLFNNFHLKMRS